MCRGVTYFLKSISLVAELKEDHKPQGKVRAKEAPTIISVWDDAGSVHSHGKTEFLNTLKVSVDRICCQNRCKM